MEKKITQRELYERIMATMSDDAEVVAMCEKKIEQLDAKKASSKQSPKQAENAAILDAVIAALSNRDRMTVGEMLRDESIAAVVSEPLTSQRVTAIVSRAADEKYGTPTLVRVVEKKIAYYSLP